MAKALSDFYGGSLAADRAASLIWLKSRVGGPFLGEFQDSPPGAAQIVSAASKAANRATILVGEGGAPGIWTLTVRGHAYTHEALANPGDPEADPPIPPSWESAESIAAALAASAASGEAGVINIWASGNLIEMLAVTAGSVGNSYTAALSFPPNGGGGVYNNTFVGGGETKIMQGAIAPGAPTIQDFDDYAVTTREAIDIGGARYATFAGGPIPNNTSVSGNAYNLDSAKSYTIKVFALTDALYQQGSTITVPAGTSGTYGWGPVTAGGPLILAILYESGVPIANTNHGVGPKLSDYKAKLWAWTDTLYLQEDDVPVVKLSAMQCVVGGAFVWSDVNNPVPVFTILFTPPATDITVYTSRNVEPPYKELPRSVDIRPENPLYKDIEEVWVNGLPVLHNRCWIYDAALAIIAFTVAGELALAQNIISRLNYLIDNPDPAWQPLPQANGSLVFSYDIYFGQVDLAYIRSGANAWVAIAYALYVDETGDVALVETHLRKLLDFLRTLQSTTEPSAGLISVGYGYYTNPGYLWNPGWLDGYSTEHNVDCYFAFRKAAFLLNDPVYEQTASKIRSALVRKLWVPRMATTPGHFAGGMNDVSGVTDPEGSLDAQTWGGMFLHDIGDLRRETEAQQYAKENFYFTGATINEPPYTQTTPMDGFRPYGPGTPDSLWAEGTWGAIEMLLRATENNWIYKAFPPGYGAGSALEAYISNLVDSMKVLRSTPPNDGGIIAFSAAFPDLPWEFGVIKSIAPTAWFYILAAAPHILLSILGNNHGRIAYGTTRMVRRQ